MAKVNKVVRIALAGGIIGLLTTNPRCALDQRIDKENQEGWTATYFITHSETNLFMSMLRLLVLFLTLFLWTFSAGYLILVERETAR